MTTEVVVLYFAKSAELAEVRSENITVSHQLTSLQLWQELVTKHPRSFNLSSLWIKSMSQPANDIGSAGLEVENADMSSCEIAANDIVKLTHGKLSTEEVSASVVCPSCGAVSLFIGITRNSFEGKKVVELEYEAYIPMAQSEMKKICWDVRRKWLSVKHIAIHHRLGVVPVSEASVIIAISSPHRSESLEAVKYCIDTLKATVPIWKKEIYETEDCSWKENKECRWAGSREK